MNARNIRVDLTNTSVHPTASGNGARVSAGLGEAWNPASWNPATWNPTTWVANQQWTDPNVPVTTNVWDTQVNYNTWPGQQPAEDTQASLGQCQSSLRDSAELVQLGNHRVEAQPLLVLKQIREGRALQSSLECLLRLGGKLPA